MNEQKNINSEGENPHSEGNFAHSVATTCTQLTTIFSFNRLGLPVRAVTSWLRGGRSTQGERGAVKTGYRKWRSRP